MKPVWDELSEEYKDSSSVVIADVDCTVEADLCGDYDVSGYPTIKYFTAETDEKGDSYDGGRDMDSLRAHVKDKLEKLCSVADPADCNDKEVAYIAKMKAKGEADITKQFDRLTKMKEDSKMEKSLKQWLLQRLSILRQFQEAAAHLEE